MLGKESELGWNSLKWKEIQMLKFLQFKNTKFPIHIFLLRLMPYLIFPRIVYTDLQVFPAGSLPTFSNKSISKMLRFPQLICFKMIRDISWTILSTLLYPKLKIIGFGTTRSENHENDDFSGFPKWNRKVTSPQLSGTSKNLKFGPTEPHNILILFLGIAPKKTWYLLAFVKDFFQNTSWKILCDLLFRQNAKS